MTTDKLLSALHNLCKEQMWCFALQYSEAENMWYAEASGTGEREYWEVKRCISPNQALERLLEKLDSLSTFD